MSRSKIPSQAAQRKANDEVYAEGLALMLKIGPRKAHAIAEATFNAMMDNTDPGKDLAKQWATQSLKHDLWAIAEAEGKYSKGYAEIRMKHIIEMNNMRKKLDTYSIF